MSEWKSVEDGIPESYTGIFRVRITNGDEMTAFFYQDRMQWIALYGQKPSHWWKAESPHPPIHNVTHWKEFKVALWNHDFQTSNISTVSQ